MKQLAGSTLFAVITCATFAIAQGQATSQELEKQKQEWSTNAHRLLAQAIDEVQSLPLTENRIQIQIKAADLLWDYDQTRSRAMFVLAGDAIAQLKFGQEPAKARSLNPIQRTFELRRELVLTVARHDGPLAYQLLASTKPPPTDPRFSSFEHRNSEDILEQGLLATLAASDPRVAAQNADRMLEEGLFPNSLSQVISRLRQQDSQAATKLADRTVKRLQSAIMLSNAEATTLAMEFLNSGPRVISTVTPKYGSNPTAIQIRGPVLDEAQYVDLLRNAIDAALKISPLPRMGQRLTNNSALVELAPSKTLHVVGDGTGVSGSEDIEHANAQRILAGLQRLLPQIDHNVPSRSLAVRQKLAQMGIADDGNEADFDETLNLLLGGPIVRTADTLIEAASSAPVPMQAHLYQQAALKAAEDGNTDRARRIADAYLDARNRDSLIPRIELRDLVTRAQGVKMGEVRDRLSSIPIDVERIDLLLGLANEVATKNPELQRLLLDEARQITNKRASKYADFEQQLRVAHACAVVDPARSFEILDAGISQLNELLTAAELPSGFETNAFRHGEPLVQGGSMLSLVVNQFGREIAFLARSDFARSEALAGRFQFPESRILMKIAIAQALMHAGGQ